MKTMLFKLSTLVLTLLLTVSFNTSKEYDFQDFQGQAFYISKSRMDLGKWGARLSEAQKKEVEARMKNRLEKGYVLST